MKTKNCARFLSFVLVTATLLVSNGCAVESSSAETANTQVSITIFQEGKEGIPNKGAGAIPIYVDCETCKNEFLKLLMEYSELLGYIETLQEEIERLPEEAEKEWPPEYECPPCLPSPPEIIEKIKEVYILKEEAPEEIEIPKEEESLPKPKINKAPIIEMLYPLPEEEDAPVNTPIIIEITDDHGVNKNSIKLKINQITAPYYVIGIPTRYIVIFEAPDPGLPPNNTMKVDIWVTETQENSEARLKTFSFRTGEKRIESEEKIAPAAPEKEEEEVPPWLAQVETKLVTQKEIPPFIWLIILLLIITNIATLIFLIKEKIETKK